VDGGRQFHGIQQDTTEKSPLFDSFQSSGQVQLSETVTFGKGSQADLLHACRYMQCTEALAVGKSRHANVPDCRGQGNRLQTDAPLQQIVVDRIDTIRYDQFLKGRTIGKSTRAHLHQCRGQLDLPEVLAIGKSGFADPFQALR